MSLNILAQSQHSPFFTNVVSFLRRKYWSFMFINVNFLILSSRCGLLPVQKATNYINMIIGTRIAVNNVKETTIAQFQDTFGITNHEIIDYIILNVQSSSVDGLIGILYQLLPQHILTSIVYSRKDFELFRKTWENIDKINLHVMLLGFDQKFFEYIVNDQPEFFMDLLKKPKTCWAGENGLIIHAKFIDAIRQKDCGEYLIDMIIEKYPSTDTEHWKIAIDRLIGCKCIDTVLYLYDRGISSREINIHGLYKIPIEEQDELFKALLKIVAARQLMTIELYILLLSHFDHDEINVYLVDQEYKKNIIKKAPSIIEKILAKNTCRKN